MAEPRQEILNVAGPLAAIKRMLLATRPAFLSASVLPVLVGTASGVNISGELDRTVFFLALLATALAHAGVNVLNDVYDDANGTDRINQTHIFPFTGGSRFIQNEILSAAAMARLGWVLLVLALVVGTWLTMLKGWPVAALGGIGIALGVAYSAPPLALSGRGLGEAAVGIGFGIVPVMGAAWLQSGHWDVATFAISITIGIWVAMILLINEVPDITADARSNKRTLAVRLGPKKTASLYLGLHMLAVGPVVAMVASKILAEVALVLPVIMLIGAYRAARAIENYSPAQSQPQFTRAIKITLTIHALGCLWLGLWVLY